MVNMKKYFLSKNSIDKKINYLLKKSNLSLKVIQFLTLKQIYKLLKLLSKFDENYNYSRKKIKQLSKSLYLYVNKNKVDIEIEKLINLKINKIKKTNIISRFEIILSNFIEYFFNKKQIIRY